MRMIETHVDLCSKMKIFMRSNLNKLFWHFLTTTVEHKISKNFNF